jgi:hypothetical protein
MKQKYFHCCALIACAVALVILGSLIKRDASAKTTTKIQTLEMSLKARDEIKKWFDATFKQCSNSQSKDEDRYVVFDGRLINFSGLEMDVKVDPLSRLDQKDGIEFRGTITFTKADHREYDINADRWGRFSENTFASKGGGLPHLIKFEKTRSSDWQSAFDSPYRSISLPCGSLTKGSGLAGLLESSGAIAPKISAIEMEARNEAENFARRVFVNCGSESSFSIIRTATRDYKILEVKGLKASISHEDDVSAADKANGITWKGTGVLKAKVSREYLPSRNDPFVSKKGWQDWEDIKNSQLIFFPIEKRNGEWFIEGSTYSGYGDQCAPTCDLLATPNELHQVIENRLYEIISLENKINIRLRNFPFVLCASYHDYMRKTLELRREPTKKE